MMKAKLQKTCQLTPKKMKLNKCTEGGSCNYSVHLAIDGAFAQDFYN